MSISAKGESTSSASEQPASEAPDASDVALKVSTRSILLRDSAIFLVLLLSTAALYAVTSFLFRSFTAKRAQLAAQLATSGKNALQAGQPDQAIEDLRTALEYAPEDRSSHLLLAEALAKGRHTEEATNYFLSLREAEPANGFINLQLARLYRQKNDTSHALDAYRAAALGIWDQDGVSRRLQAQLELSDYLLQLGRAPSARVELLMAAQNAPESSSVSIRLGDELLAAKAPAAALASYQKAVKLEPGNFEALYKAAHLAYELSDYAQARSLTEKALRKRPDKQQEKDLLVLAQNSERLLQLSMGHNLPAGERLQHIRTGITIAKRRFDQCSASFPAGALPLALQNLNTEWQQAKPSTLRAAMQNVAGQDAAVQLIFDTEVQTAQLCGTPAGDDALLLHLAQTSQPGPQEKP